MFEKGKQYYCSSDIIVDKHLWFKKGFTYICSKPNYLVGCDHCEHSLESICLTGKISCFHPREVKNTVYKYIGGKFKINDITILSENDIITIREVYEPKSGNFNNVLSFTMINNTTGSEIKNPTGVYNSICKYLTPLNETNDIDEEDDKVNHPSHYTWLKELCGIEVIDITRHMDFDLGNALKYILRCGHKSENGYTDKDKAVEDLKKAVFYLNDKINMLS